MTDDIVEHVARGLARQAGEAEEDWRQYEDKAVEAVATMRQATPEILANIRRRK